ncbi:hypothetical protein AC739_15205 [Planococcus glaciei]|uniref:hypothetical protein n=1 Tax=Planococcus glaciei TaxID=459472 RepID=UPI00069E66B3|nr:hypothetical protein [Planococcus glaciei]KOF09467.1 hypothetical protein AC739_15205 [Planococcus glaciei]
MSNNKDIPRESNRQSTPSKNFIKNNFRNELGQLLYLDYEIDDLKKRNYVDSLSKAVNRKLALIEVIENVDHPSLKNALKKYYIDKLANEFIEDSVRKLKSRHLPRISSFSEQDIKNTEIAKKQLSMALNNRIILSNEDLEIVISKLDDSFDRIIIRKSLFDKKNNAQIAKEISTTTFRRLNSTTNEKSNLDRSTVSRRIKKLKFKSFD